MKIVIAALQNNNLKAAYAAESKDKAENVEKFDKLDTANAVTTAFKIAEDVQSASRDSKKFLNQV